jgi:ATP-dependent DNA helicase RecG
MFPEIAVRELVANALIHQDFNESGTSVMIEIYDDRMEISNPGKAFIPPDRFIDEYQSRNERLAALMRRLGICEEKGSGVDKVVHAAEVYQLPAPDFRVGECRTSAILFAHQDIEEMDRNDRTPKLATATDETLDFQTLKDRFDTYYDNVRKVAVELHQRCDDYEFIEEPEPPRFGQRVREILDVFSFGRKRKRTVVK